MPRKPKILAFQGTGGRPLRIYCDTSVIGGCFDAEFKQASLKLFAQTREGRFILVLSGTTLEELNRAPARVQREVKALPEWAVERVFLTREMETLRDAYIRAGVVGESSRYDAEHIACATVAEVDVIVSWNFKHIVNFERIRGYHPIPIHTPAEVIEP